MRRKRAGSSLIILLICSGGFVWSETDRFKVIASKLRVRSKPNVESSVVATLQEGTIISIVNSSTFTQTIDGITTPWKEIATSSGPLGWVFSGYLALVAGGEDSQYLLSKTGKFGGGEVGLEDGDKVFTFSMGPNGEPVLYPDTVRIDMVYDDLLDPHHKNEKTGKLVSLKSKRPGNILLLKGPFKQGRVNIAQIPPLDQCSDEPCVFLMKDTTYTIKVISVQDVEPEPGSVIKKNTVSTLPTALKQL